MSNLGNPEQMGVELRTGQSAALKQRRRIVALYFFSCATLGVVALYQIGVLKKLPEPKWRGFNSRKVNGSAQAYAILATPDAFLGLASYAVTAALAAMGPEDRVSSHPWIALALGAKALGDSAVAGKLTLDEITKLRAFSLPSLLTATATWTAFALALPEVWAASRRLRKGHDHA